MGERIRQRFNICAIYYIYKVGYITGVYYYLVFVYIVKIEDWGDGPMLAAQPEDLSSDSQHPGKSQTK